MHLQFWAMSKKSTRITRSQAFVPASERIDRYFAPTEQQKRKSTQPVTPEEEDTEVMQATKRRQQYHIQNQWVPITDVDSDSIMTRTLVPSPFHPTTEPPCHGTMQAAGASQYRFKNIFTSNTCASRTPLPSLKWGEAQDVWDVMKAKDRKYMRDMNMLQRHPHLQCRMRAILLDWIIEVCEVYRLHRETFYLTVDFIDRYLSTQYNLQKNQLQLIGVTALFIASKIEEIYPPKISDFAYVTDGACAEAEITNQELVILKALKWDLSPMTVNMWMSVYLQLLNNTKTGDKESSLSTPMFSGHSFVQLARLMDLCMLDVGSLEFAYGVIAASALYHFSNESSTYKATGFAWEEIVSCVNWMAPFAIAVRDTGPVHMKLFENVMYDDNHNIQTHTVDLDMLESAQLRLQQTMQKSSRASPEHPAQLPDTILTPPPSMHKHSAASSILS